jgi:hypothetical protein
MLDDDLPPLPGPSGVRPWRRYLPHLGMTIIARVVLGESLSEVCRDPEMPARGTVNAWAKADTDFGARLRAARIEGGHLVRGRKPVWCPHVAKLILRRLAEGLSLKAICAEAGMPCEGTVYRWVHEREDFARGYGQARALQAHRKFDQVWEVAEAATAGTATVARMQIDALKWQAARLAPTRYGAKAEGEAGAARSKAAEAEPEAPETVRIAHFAGRNAGEETWYKEVTWPSPDARDAPDDGAWAPEPWEL